MVETIELGLASSGDPRIVEWQTVTPREVFDDFSYALLFLSCIDKTTPDIESSVHLSFESFLHVQYFWK